MISEHEATAILKDIDRYAHQRCWIDGGQLDVEEYRDAALDTLVDLLACYTPRRGVPFLAYARLHLRWAVCDTAQRYRIWRDVRKKGGRGQTVPHAHLLRPHQTPVSAPAEVAQVLRHLSPDAAQYTRLALTGVTQGEYGDRRGWPRDKSGKGCLRTWRQQQQWWAPFREATNQGQRYTSLAR